jgi:tetratricopeptide (TPR) repeat protein
VSRRPRILFQPRCMSFSPSQNHTDNVGYAALKQHDKTIEDASSALALNPDYSKALRRRAHAYEETNQDEQALSDWTAACIVEEFKFQDCTNSVQRVLKRLAETKTGAKRTRVPDTPQKLIFRDTLPRQVVNGLYIFPFPKMRTFLPLLIIVYAVAS